jgi:hypothetical protein
MAAALSLLLLLALLQGLCAQKAHLLCLHYDKLAAQFCNNLFSHFSRACKISLSHHYGETNKNVEVRDFYKAHSDLLLQNGLLSVRSQPFDTDWAQLFSIPGHSFRVFLIMREPFEKIVSTYTYYSQSPPPEKWLGEKFGGLCPDQYARSDVEHLAKYFGDYHRVMHWMDRIMAVCRTALSMFKPGESYASMLQIAASLQRGNLSSAKNQTAARLYLSSIHRYEHDYERHGPDLYPALRLEAFRALPDLIDMAVSRIFADPSLSLSIPLDPLIDPIDPTPFAPTARKLMEFSLPNLTGCFTKHSGTEALIQMQTQLLYPPAHYPRLQINANSNTTSTEKKTILSPSVHREYIYRLAEDPILSPLLHLIAKVARTPDYPRDRLVDHPMRLKHHHSQRSTGEEGHSDTEVSFT